MNVNARSLLLMALPNEHQLTFSQYDDAKTMFASIETQFGGNEDTKKTQKTLLKQQYENFSASSTDTDAQNLAFMTALSTSSTNDANTAKPAYEVSTVSPNVNTTSHQLSTASFSNNVVYAFMIDNPNGYNLLQQDLEQIHEDGLEAMDLKWQLSLLSMRAKRYFQRTGKKIFINANDTARYDKSKIVCFNCYKMGHFAREYRATRNKEEEQVQTNMALMVFSDSEIIDKSKKGLRYNDVPPPHPLIYNRPKKLDLSYSGLDEFKDPEFKSYGSMDSKQESNIVCDKKSDASKENSDDSLVKEQVLDDTSSFVESPLNISDQPEEQLGVFSSATALSDAARKRQSVENVQTYTRRSRLVSTADVSTASEYGSTAGVKAKDKGKAIMQESEPPKKIKKRVQFQMSVDEELAKKVFEEEQAKFKEEQEQEKSDFEIALELQKQLDEREEVVAQAHDIDWSDPAVIRYHTLQNRPFSVAEVRKNMCMYLKNQGGYKLSHFKGMSYEDIRPIFKRVWDQNQAFVPKDSNIEKEKLEDDTEKEELQVYLNIVLEEESLNIESLATKYPITASPEGYDLLLWGDMKTMIERNEEDEIWRTQQDWNLINWKLHNFCGVHVLLMDTGFVIHMMVEKKYPLLQDTLSKMLSKRIEVDHQSEMGYELIRGINFGLFQVLGSCDELDGFVSIPDEGDMAFLRKKVKSGAAVGKRVLLQVLVQ
ncbi:ribonuclease H-like domain-containing protein [Tanacetum coccineum]